MAFPLQGGWGLALLAERGATGGGPRSGSLGLGTEGFHFNEVWEERGAEVSSSVYSRSASNPSITF